MDRFIISGYFKKEKKYEFTEATKVPVSSEPVESTSTSSAVFSHSPAPAMPPDPEETPSQQHCELHAVDVGPKVSTEISSAEFSDSTENILLKKNPGKRTFRESWLIKYPWLEYKGDTDACFCKICQKYSQEQTEQFGKETVKFGVNSFTTIGFRNWKKAIEKFNIHELSNYHKKNVIKETFVKKGVNIQSQISAAHNKTMIESTKALLNILSSIRFLAQQGLALRGHNDDDSNLYQLLKLRSEDVPELKTWLGRTNYRWLSHDVVNEILQMLADSVLRDIICEVKNEKYYSIMIDETSDIAVKEQVSLCIRSVNKNLEINEYFLGFYETAQTDAYTLFTIVKDVLTRFNLPICDLRGQCYDGAANVSGKYNGVQARVREVEPRALYVHCQAHSLNLVAQDCMKKVEEARDVLGLIQELITFIRDSPKRLSWFTLFQDTSHASLRPFCPTRWTLKHSSVASVLVNYDSLLEFLATFSSTEKNDAGCKAKGFFKQLTKSDTFIMLKIIEKILSHLEGTNTSLQKRKMHLRDCVDIISNLRTTISKMRETFDLKWLEYKNLWEELQLESPEVPRKRKRPLKYEYGSNPSIPSTSHSFTPEEKYDRIFKEIIDSILVGINSRFNSEYESLLLNAEDFLINGSASSALTMLCEFYKDDLNKSKLKLHCDMLHDILKAGNIELHSFSDLVIYFKEQPTVFIPLTEVTKLMILLSVIPLTSCTSEVSFSMLRRLKTYVRTSMLQKRLNHLSILNCHKEKTEQLDLNKICHEFINKNNIRTKTFALLS